MLRVVRSVDEHTGEVYSEKSRYIQDTLNEEGYRVPSHKKGSRMFDNIYFPAEMGYSDIGRLTVLAKMMIPYSNMLGYRARGGIVAYGEKCIMEKLGLSEKRGRQFLAKMIRLGIMQRVTRVVDSEQVVEYYINPAYFFAGKRISINLYLLFREHLDGILPKWVIKEFQDMAQPKK